MLSKPMGLLSTLLDILLISLREGAASGEGGAPMYHLTLLAAEIFSKNIRLQETLGMVLMALLINLIVLDLGRIPFAPKKFNGPSSYGGGKFSNAGRHGGGRG